jgi:hypothetical protein
VQVKNKRERSSLVRHPGVEKTSRLRSRDPVASGVKCGPNGGMNRKMKSWTVSWLSFKTKVGPGLRGSRVMSGDWRRLHQVRGVSSGSPENHCVPWLIHKAKTEEPKWGTRVGIAWLASRLAGCYRRASVQWSDDKDIRFLPRGACILN